MPYASQADLVARFGATELLQVTDRAQTGSIDAAVVTAALTDADAVINGYLAGRYAVPVSPTPPLLTRLCADIARFELRGESAGEAVRQAYEDAIKLLRDLSNGVAVLAGATAATAAPAPTLLAGSVKVAAPSCRRLGPDQTWDFRA